LLVFARPFVPDDGDVRALAGPDVLADLAVAQVDAKLRRVRAEVLVRVHGREIALNPARVAVKRAAAAREEEGRVQRADHPR
jgi:hypothetical protein